jgi:putative DNA primase/helicase
MSVVQLGVVTPLEQRVEPDISRTDVGLAEHFVTYLGDRFAYIPAKKAGAGDWLRCDGFAWEPASETVLDQWIAAMGRQLLREAAVAPSREERDKLHKRGERALSNAGIHAIRSRVAAVESVVTTIDAFDTHPHLLGVANGVVDLQTGKLLPADPALRLSRAARFDYNPRAEAPTWRRFLLEVFDGNQDVAAAYEADLGYTLTGETREQVFFVDHGLTGANGKSVLHETVKEILGSRLVVSSKPATFMQGKYTHEANRTRDDVIRWRGARMIQRSEFPEAARLDEDLIKSLTGGDHLTARGIYRDEEEFLPVGKLWIRTNHFPDLDPGSAAIWRRVRPHESRSRSKAARTPPSTASCSPRPRGSWRGWCAARSSTTSAAG